MKSKSWDWEKEKNNIWFEPSIESYYFAERWKNANYNRLLDYGCGLGRHSILFAKKGFSVSAFDLSQYGIDFLIKWAEQENLCIKTEVADTAKLPYPDNSFDCIFAYHVISHTTTEGFINVLAEMKRVLKHSGEFFITLCSKETWSFTQANYPKIDENSVLKTDDGAEKNVPHFYVSVDDILKYFSDCTLLDIKHTDHCFFQNKKQNSKHYYILGKK